MLPLIADTLLESISLLASSLPLLADKVVAGLRPNRQRLNQALASNPVLVTALNAKIGYERGAEIAKRAYAEGRPVFDVACESLDFEPEQLRALLDPQRLTHGGLS